MALGSAADEFARWFDLKPALAKKAFGRLDAAGELAHVEVDGTPGAIPVDQLDALATQPSKREPVVHLLPAFDPYMVAATRQLDSIGATGHKGQVSRPQGWISPTLVVDGWIRGIWEPADGGRPTVTPFGTLPTAVRRRLPEPGFLIDHTTVIPWIRTEHPSPTWKDSDCGVGTSRTVDGSYRPLRPLGAAR